MQPECQAAADPQTMPLSSTSTISIVIIILLCPKTDICFTVLLQNKVCRLWQKRYSDSMLNRRSQ